jgi:hypothetical protein
MHKYALVVRSISVSRPLTHNKLHPPPIWVRIQKPRANPTIASYNANAVKINNATGSIS